MEVNLYKDMTKELVNLKEMINKEILNNKNFNNVKLIRFAEATDSRLPKWNIVYWYKIIFSRRFEKITLWFNIFKYDSELSEFINWWEVMVIPDKIFKLKTKEDVLLKLKEYLTALTDDTNSLEELKQKLEQSKRDKSKEIETLDKQIKEVNSLLNEKK